MHDGLPGGYMQLLHPLAQLEAACEFCACVEAFAADDWPELYKDRPPTAERLDEVQPGTLLDTLARLS